jgi:hypothetical protein
MVFKKWEGQQPSGQVRVYDFKAKGEVFEASWRVDLDHALRWSSFDDADGVRRRAVAAAFDNDHPSATLAVMGFSGKSLLTSSPTRSQPRCCCLVRGENWRWEAASAAAFGSSWALHRSTRDRRMKGLA